MDAGCHGLVTPVNASEFTALSDAERIRVIEISAQQANKRLPVIAGVAGVTSSVAREFTKQAAKAGVDGVIAMPPYITKASFSEILDYYKQVADAADGLPVMIQNYVAPVGTPMSAEECVEIVRNVENVLYVKEETIYSGHVITQIAELAGNLPEGSYLGTMGGKAGRYLIDEYRRGSCGNMPACEIADIQAEIWNTLEAGDEKKAIQLYYRALPLLNMEFMYGHILYKEVLYLRGVLDSPAVRTPNVPKLDSYDISELRRILKELNVEVVR